MAPRGMRIARPRSSGGYSSRMGQAGMAMPDEKSNLEGDKDVEIPRGEVLARVLREHDLFSAQREKRVDLLKRLEEHEREGQSGKKVGCLAFFSTEAAGIDSADVPAFGDALMSLGDVDELDLIINSPGGDGTVAEKIIELCRAYCKEFKVIVPNRAKSAATVVALGADEIIMGYCSELGPIDAQVPIVVSGIPRYISAQSFIDARTTLEKKIQERDQEEGRSAGHTPANCIPGCPVHRPLRKVDGIQPRSSPQIPSKVHVFCNKACPSPEGSSRQSFERVVVGFDLQGSRAND